LHYNSTDTSTSPVIAENTRVPDRAETLERISRIKRKIDSDSDGSLSAQEIAETSIVLTALDKNKDGMLTPDETHGGR
jgi:hypothetical protein